MGRRIEVVPYDSSWPAAFELEREKVSLVFQPILESVHHVGSTSVPGLSAKPVIDILVVVHDDSAIADYDGRMSGLQYTPRGECLDAGGTPGRFYYSKTVNGVRTHQVHVCRAGHFEIAEMSLFARYLREHGDVADTYARLKLAAISGGDFDTPRYMARKHDWIRATTRKALAHYGVSSQRPPN